MGGTRFRSRVAVLVSDQRLRLSDQVTGLFDAYDPLKEPCGIVVALWFSSLGESLAPAWRRAVQERAAPLGWEHISFMLGDMSASRSQPPDPLSSTANLTLYRSAVAELVDEADMASGPDDADRPAAEKVLDAGLPVPELTGVLSRVPGGIDTCTTIDQTRPAAPTASRP
jgi:hypothetical protein